MNPEQFAYWLQGFSEVSDEKPTADQWKIIKDHLALVFDKKTPYYNLGKLPEKYEFGQAPDAFGNILTTC